MTRRRLLVIDIGSHKLEELLVLLGPYLRQVGIYFTWAFKKTVKNLLTLNLGALRGLGRQWQVIRYYFLSRRRFELQIVSVEPNPAVANPYVNRIRAHYPVHYMPVAVLGHDATSPAELKTLYFYDHSISSSIYQKKNRSVDAARTLLCVGLRFEVIWNGLVRENIVSADTPFLLRMNCEGAELGVVEACSKLGLRPRCVIGSIGDVGKIHGSDSEEKTNRIMKELGAPYHYFKGDDPATWHPMIEIWERYTGEFRTTS